MEEAHRRQSSILAGSTPAAKAAKAVDPEDEEEEEA